MLENLYLWIGLASAAIILAIIYFSVQTSKKRAREVEELYQHFPEKKDPPVTVENMREKLRRVQKEEDDTESKVNRKNEGSTQENREKENNTDAEIQQEIKETEQIIAEDGEDDGEKPERYRRSIFHPDHLKTEENESKNE